MDPVSPLPALAALIAALATVYSIVKIFGAPPPLGRYLPIDGLRGYLAFCVFLCHACVWYSFLRDGKWLNPPSNLYTHFGQSDVMLFFMITGFLFFSKLLDARNRSIDWGRLFVSRFLRLVPMYLFVMLLLFAIVAVLSGGTLREPVSQLAVDALRWLGFTIYGVPDLNGVEGTSHIVASVTWSLRYEWPFYFALPLMALLLRLRPPLRYIAFGAVATAICVYPMPPAWIFPAQAFLGGIAASLLARLDAFRRWAQTPFAAIAIVVLLGVVIVVFPTAFDWRPLALLGVAFSLIAGGNTLFGALTNRVSRTLGEMAYSIYLLHGIVLFVLFTFVLGADRAKGMTAAQHWGVLVAVTPLLIAICYITFRCIEHPAMHSTDAVTASLRAKLRSRAKNVTARSAVG